MSHLGRLYAGPKVLVECTRGSEVGVAVATDAGCFWQGRRGKFWAERKPCPDCGRRVRLVVPEKVA